MDTITKIRQRARVKPMTIALPEYRDKRTIEAAKTIEKEGIARPLLLTDNNIDARLRERYIAEFTEMRKAKGMDVETARRLFEDPLYYAAMLTRDGKADGFVAGASHTSSDVGRVSIHCLGVDARISVACSCFIMVVPNCPYGENGTLIYADCGLIPDPTPRQLAAIAVAAGEMAKKVLDITPHVALLSYSTKGSSKGKAIDKVVEALGILREMAPDLAADGELQVDAALVPDVARIKCPDSPVAGKANVLIFPDLQAGNIGYKLTERLSGGRALGPLMLGLSKPCSDLSRGCSSDDIVDCAAVTAIRAQ